MYSREKKKKKVEGRSWIHKKEAMDSEEPLLQREVDEFISWVSVFQKMDDIEMRIWLLSHHHLPSTETKAPAIKQVQSSSIRPNLLQGQRSVRPKPPKYHANTLMAAVWKFHSDEDQTPTI